jgi:hypothetical protein
MAFTVVSLALPVGGDSLSPETVQALTKIPSTATEMAAFMHEGYRTHQSHGSVRDGQLRSALGWCLPPTGATPLREAKSIYG